MYSNEINNVLSEFENIEAPKLNEDHKYMANEGLNNFNDMENDMCKKENMDCKDMISNEKKCMKMSAPVSVERQQMNMSSTDNNMWDGVVKAIRKKL